MDNDEVKIVSLLPSATEIIFALGLGEDLRGVSFECDYPEAARTVPVVSGPPPICRLAVPVIEPE